MLYIFLVAFFIVLFTLKLIGTLTVGWGLICIPLYIFMAIFIIHVAAVASFSK